MGNLNIHFWIGVIALLTSFTAQRVSTTIGGAYDENKNQTAYFVLPYGTVHLPGKWEKTHYNSISNQQFFVNQDSVKIAIAFEASTNYEFNTNGSKTGFEFVKSSYDWDSNYFVEKHELKRSLFERDSVTNYLIWRLFGGKGQEKFDMYFLFGEKKGNVSNFSVMLTGKWTESEKIKFLKELYLHKNEE